MTSVECISADGRALTPLVIHRGKLPNKPYDIWFPPSAECPDFHWGFSKKGWTSDEYGVKWLTENFIPQTDSQGEWRALFLDGHGSHCTGEFLYECLTNAIVPIFLIPHTSHLMQPCDLGPFAQLKRLYGQKLADHIKIGRAEITRADFNVLYNEARQQGMTKQYIQAGWSRSGLEPFSLDKVRNKDELRAFRQPTLDLLPPASIEIATPQGRQHFKALAGELSLKLTPRGKHQLLRLEHAYERESSARIALAEDTATARKHTYEEEATGVRKRMKKTDQGMTWNLRQVMEARGHPEAEIEEHLRLRAERDKLYEAKV